MEDPSPDETDSEVSQDIQAAAHVRDGCGGFNGQVYHDSNRIHVWGKMWDSCGAGTYNQLFLGFKWNGSPQNWKLDTAGARKTVGVDFDFRRLGLFPGSIKLTLCGHWQGGWHCGPSQGF